MRLDAIDLFELLQLGTIDLNVLACTNWHPKSELPTLYPWLGRRDINTELDSSQFSRADTTTEVDYSQHS